MISTEMTFLFELLRYKNLVNDVAVILQSFNLVIKHNHCLWLTSECGKCIQFNCTYTSAVIHAGIIIIYINCDTYGL